MHGNQSAAAGGPHRKQAIPRGKEAIAAHVRAIPLRVTVTGVDGTFELTRMVHEALAARRRRVFAQGGFDDERPGARLRLRSHGPRRLLKQVARAGRIDAPTCGGFVTGVGADSPRVREVAVSREDRCCRRRPRRLRGA